AHLFRTRAANWRIDGCNAGRSKIGTPWEALKLPVSSTMTSFFRRSPRAVKDPRDLAVGFHVDALHVRVSAVGWVALTKIMVDTVQPQRLPSFRNRSALSHPRRSTC